MEHSFEKIRTILFRCYRFILSPAILAGILLLSGCSGSMFTAYPQKIVPLISGLKTGNTIQSEQCLIEECKGSDLILYNMERGRVAHIVGNLDASMRDFTVSIARIKENDEKAVVSATGVMENVGSAFTNDNAISYEGEGYERVLLHHYQALNYLKKKDLDGAGVEVRRANSEQEDALKRFESEVEKAQNDAKEKKIGKSDQSAVDARYAQLDEVAGKVKNSFQNAYTFYISAFIYELLNQPNDAYIDYKKALEIYPENRYLQKDVVRLAASLNMGEDLEELKKRFSLESPARDSGDEGGELLVLFEDGFAPVKEEVKISLPVPKAGFVSVAFPIYKERWTPQNPLTVLADNQSLGNTEPICDVRALAVKSLKEKIPMIATRQIIRAVAKGASNYAAKKNLGALGEIGMSVINSATENADLRSWLTLPSNAQLLRATLSSGFHKVEIRYAGKGSSTFADVEIPSKGKAILQVTRTGSRFYTSSASFSSKFQ